MVLVRCLSCRRQKNIRRCGGGFIYAKIGKSSIVECENKCDVGEVSRGL